MLIKSAKDLEVYKKAYSLAMKIFELSRAWPGEEKFSLIDQIRRASLKEQCRQIGSMLGAMLNNPKPFLLRSADL